MNTISWDTEMSLFDFATLHPESIALLQLWGLEGIVDEHMLTTLGRSISLKDALKTKSIKEEDFLLALQERLKKQKVWKEKKGPEIRVSGVLPCPVRIPLQEMLEAFLEARPEPKQEVLLDLKAASMGVDWLIDDVKKRSPEALPDLFLSAGFDLFFDDTLFGHHRRNGVFEDMTPWTHYNADFEREDMTLRDPQGQYGMIAVVPDIFLINMEELQGRAIPGSWEDLLQEEYQGSVSLPIGDFDLFNAILLNLYKRYGDEGIKKLSLSLLSSMHPAQMVKSHTKEQDKPLVTIMPYFFTKMLVPNSPMQAVWPSDGAIVSPIFMLAKREKKEQLQPLVDFFCSMAVAELLSVKGKFPSVHPAIDNRFTNDQQLMWLGWDFMEENDIGETIRHCERLFGGQERKIL